VARVLLRGLVRAGGGVGIVKQLAPVSSQRSQRKLGGWELSAVGATIPCHSPGSAVNVAPTWALPPIDGSRTAVGGTKNPDDPGTTSVAPLVAVTTTASWMLSESAGDV
jgi:hypothetical protein